MKTSRCYYYWVLATVVSLPSATTAWTGSPLVNRGSSSSSSLLRMSKSESSDTRHNFSRLVDPNVNNLDVDLAAVNALINERVFARKQKDFRAADNILNQLLVRHAVIINDTDNTWKTGTKREVKKRPKITLARQVRDPNNRGNHDYKISPDAGPNTSTLSDEDVVSMIADRRLAQRDRDFNEADNIRHLLKQQGVYVEDGLKEWRADGIPFGAGGSHRGHASTSPTSLVRSDYSLSLLNDEDDTLIVNNLLAQRQKFKSGGNYEKADSIRDGLFETYNIRIDDRLGEWSVGGNFGDEHNSHWATTSSVQSRGYEKSATSEDLLSAADQEYVQAKVDERMRAKRTRNYELSDSIRDDLFRMFDVTIHDKINEWSVGGDFGDDNSWTHVQASAESSTVNKKELIIDEGGKEFDTSFESYYAERDSEGRGADVASLQEEISASVLSKEQLARLTVVQLKQKLRDSGAKVGGTKEELINRLLS
jgi:cysteinyl-tRNA synthetase